MILTIIKGIIFIWALCGIVFLGIILFEYHPLIFGFIFISSIGVILRMFHEAVFSILFKEKGSIRERED